MEWAKPLITQYAITSSVDTLLHRPSTDFTVDRKKATFARYYTSNVDPSWEIEVKTISLPTPASCRDTDLGMPAGVEVTVKNRQSGVVNTITKDTSIPASRNCAHDYDIEAIYAASASNMKTDPLIAIIGVYSRGFEGSHRRFIAVPFAVSVE